ncbi:MAG: hypothetical protein MUF00_16475 [Gemmatimonadaceae bacterium]|nr:hypothetical protein [Gemmatimonadaceae bacterium]
MTKRKAKSAADFLAELSADKGYSTEQNARQEERIRREQYLRALTRPLLDELSAAGFPVDSLDSLVPRHAPLPASITGLLLRHLPIIDEVAIQTQLVRALGVSATPLPAEPLVRVFRETHSDALRYAIANTLACTEVRDVGAWLLSAVRNREYRTARQMLVLALARRVQPSQANPILLELLDEMPGHVALALAESGGVAELSALEHRYTSTAGWEKKEIGKAISVIRRRAQEQ